MVLRVRGWGVGFKNCLRRDKNIMVYNIDSVANKHPTNPCLCSFNCIIQLNELIIDMAVQKKSLYFFIFYPFLITGGEGSGCQCVG
jgi:kynurenine formamidase